MNNQEINRKIAEWLGLNPKKHILGDGNDVYCEGNSNVIIKNYSTSDSDAITLLPVLVERGYEVTLETICDKWFCAIEGKESYHSMKGKTISQAICSAVLELIKKEKEK